MLTNQITKKYVEPRLLILTDPRIDYNALKESSYVNIPIIALCNTDNNLQFVDCAIPCNNRSGKSLAMIYWILTREVMQLRGNLKEGEQLNEMVDMFMYRDIEKKDAKVEEHVEGGAYNDQYDEAQGEENVDEGDEDFVGAN